MLRYGVCSWPSNSCMHRNSPSILFCKRIYACMCVFFSENSYLLHICSNIGSLKVRTQHWKWKKEYYYVVLCCKEEQSHRTFIDAENIKRGFASRAQNQCSVTPRNNQNKIGVW